MRRLAFAALLLLGPAGCVQSFDSTTLGIPVTMGEVPGAAGETTPFRTRSHSVHAFWGLLTLQQANLQKSLARQLVGGQQVGQLKIKSQSRWSDVLLTVLTLGLVVPRTVTYQGVIIGR